MTWTKLGDEFPAAARELTDAEFRTHAEALCWSSMRLLDLRVPKADVRRFAESPDAELAVKGLVAKGWWADDGDAWNISLHFPEWQQDRAQVEHRRAYLAEAQRRSKRHRAGDHSLCLPGKCPQAPSPSTSGSTPTSTVDSTVGSTPDPGRVGSGQVPPDPQVQDQDPSQDQKPGALRLPQVANSKTASSRLNDQLPVDDAQQFPRHDSERTTDGTGARARRTDTPAA